MDLTDFQELKSYLNPIQIQDIGNIFSKSLAMFSNSAVESKAEVVLQGLEQVISLFFFLHLPFCT
jgi:hypothetical protein